jgi:hypothetical protein
MSAIVMLLAGALGTTSRAGGSGNGGGPGGGGAKGGGKPDRAPPSISISSPTAAATLAGTVTVSGLAADDVRLAKVEVNVDGGAYQPASGAASWSFLLDTAGYANGSHTIAARATDTSGNTTDASVSVAFSNAVPDSTPPTVSISLPSPGASVAGTIAVSGSASDNAALAKVEISVDAGAYQLAEGTTSWRYSLDTTSYSDGSHTVATRATDTSGNASSTGETVSVQNSTPPPPPSASPVPAPLLSPGTIAGYAFQESDRDGVYKTGEEPLANQHLYFYKGDGTYLGNRYTDAGGWYQFGGLADGGYVVRYAPDSWWAVRDDWVPDTTGSILPVLNIQLAGSSRADFGWRPIVRSTDASSPISSFVGANGLKVQSYDDVVPAKDVYDRLMTGSLVGQEAQFATIRFDYASTGSTSTSATQLNGVYVGYHATSYVSYLSWLNQNGELFHEYGHAWSLYYAYMAQQDPKLTAYLQARGVLGDPRIGTSYAWDPKEMIAEDYRQLFGDASAQADSQLNKDIPLARDVPGLKSFLATVFTQPPAA